jgi:hypothetical protein
MRKLRLLEPVDWKKTSYSINAKGSHLQTLLPLRKPILMACLTRLKSQRLR